MATRSALMAFEERQRMLFGLVETRAGAAAQLLGAKRRHVDIEETAFDRRRLRVNNRGVFVGRRVDDRVHLRDFNV